MLTDCAMEIDCGVLLYYLAEQSNSSLISTQTNWNYMEYSIYVPQQTDYNNPPAHARELMTTNSTAGNAHYDFFSNVIQYLVCYSCQPYIYFALYISHTYTLHCISAIHILCIVYQPYIYFALYNLNVYLHTSMCISHTVSCTILYHFRGYNM